MKTEDLKRRILEADDDLPEDVRRQVERSPDLAALYRRTRSVRSLMALKNHERPPAGFDTRVRRDIMRRIRHVASEPAGGASAWWNVFTAPSGPVFRYAVATAVLALVAIHGLTTPETRVSEATWSNLETVATGIPAPAALGPVMLASTNLPHYELERLIRVLPSSYEGIAPGQIQYGPVPSVPVSY